MGKRRWGHVWPHTRIERHREAASRKAFPPCIRRIAASWATANIFPGPFTQTDNAVYDSVIRSLLRRTSAAGFSLEEVEHPIGDIGSFMARSYAEANHRWRAQLEGRPPPL